MLTYSVYVDGELKAAFVKEGDAVGYAEMLIENDYYAEVRDTDGNVWSMS